MGHPFHGWLAVARNHGGRKGGSRPEILDQHAAEVAVLFFQAAHIVFPGWGRGQWVLGQGQEIWWGRQGFAMIPKWREGRKTWRAGRCQVTLRIGRQWVTPQAQWWWHQWPHMSMRRGRQGAHGTGIKLKGRQVGPAIALLLALALSLLVVIVAVLALEFSSNKRRREQLERTSCQWSVVSKFLLNLNSHDSHNSSNSWT